MEDNKPLVSIICITYNHEKYISKCIEGFLMQKTNFKYEILINDDASPDNTVSILKDYERRYPNLIRVIYHEKNQYSGLGRKNLLCLVNLFNIAQGEFLAFCEGDDFWNDSDKLQKQVDVLLNDEELSAVYHNVNIVDENDDVVTHTTVVCDAEEHYCSVREFIDNGIIAGQGSSLVCHNFWKKLSEQQKELFTYTETTGDQLICMTNLLLGKVWYMKEAMSTYHYVINGGTSWSAIVKNKNLLLFHYKTVLILKNWVRTFGREIDCVFRLNNIAAHAYFFMIVTPKKENIDIAKEIYRLHGVDIKVIKRILWIIGRKFRHIEKIFIRESGCNKCRK